MEQSPSWESYNYSVKFPTFYGTWRFITVFTRARHWILSRTRCIQSTPSHPISLRFILISSHLCLGLPNGLMPTIFSNQDLYSFLPCMLHVLPISSWLEHLKIYEVYKLWSSSVCILLQSPATSSFSQTPSIYAPPLVWQMKFHTHTNNKKNYGFVYCKI